MKIQPFVLLMLLMSSMNLLAQEKATDSRKYDIYVSVESIQLIRQLVNFGGGTQVSNNPYLINVSLNKKETGVGLNFGIGHSYSLTRNEPEDGGDTETSTGSLSFRIGLEKKQQLSKRWSTALGFDLLKTSTNLENNSTFVTTFNHPQTGNEVNLETTTVSKSNESGFGYGGRLWFGYSFSDRLLLSSELTYYFRSSKNDLSFSQKREEFDFQTDTIIVEDDENESLQENKSANINLPLAVYLTIKF